MSEKPNGQARSLPHDQIQGLTRGPPHDKGRARFVRDELSHVLGAYDLGKIKSIRDYPRGQPRAPKALIDCKQGRLLLKRRPDDRAEPERVLAAHRAICDLIERGVPAAPLIETSAGSTAVFHENHAYELFEFIDAKHDDRSPGAALASGVMLAKLTTALEHSEEQAPLILKHGGYHDSAIVRRELEIAGDRTGIGPGLLDRYDQIVSGVRRRLRQDGGLVHGDWHPGNLLFRNHAVVAVVDFDGLRVGAGVEDLATGALQAALRPITGGLSSWPIRLDADRFLSFCRGYATGGGLGSDEIGALPGLVVESLLAEAAGPVARTGRFGSLDGKAFLEQIEGSLTPVELQVKALLERAPPAPAQAGTVV